MNENRRKILDMLASGHITAPDAEKLLNALEREPETAQDEKPKRKPKYLRVLVKSDESNPNPADVEVNVRVPLQLLRAGVRLAGLIPAQAFAKVNMAFQKDGMSLDLSQIKPENLESLIDELGELQVDVDDKSSRSRVKVFCE